MENEEEENKTKMENEKEEKKKKQQDMKGNGIVDYADYFISDTIDQTKKNG